jgi:hypothetical protein
MARLTGLEPATPGVTGRYSNQLSYNRAFSSRSGGRAVARLTGLEPATPGVTGRYSNQLSYNRNDTRAHPNVCAYYGSPGAASSGVDWKIDVCMKSVCNAALTDQSMPYYPL